MCSLRQNCGPFYTQERALNMCANEGKMYHLCSYFIYLTLLNILVSIIYINIYFYNLLILLTSHNIWLVLDCWHINNTIINKWQLIAIITNCVRCSVADQHRNIICKKYNKVCNWLRISCDVYCTLKYLLTYMNKTQFIMLFITISYLPNYLQTDAHVFLGFERIAGIWRWFDGRTYPSLPGYGLWGGDSPNDDVDCARVNRWGKTSGILSDWACSIEERRVCMMP